MNKIYANIKAIRLEKGLKQEDIAEKLGLAPSNYGRVERGLTEISIGRLEKLAEIFEMSVNSIINYDIDNNHDWEEDAFYWYEENRKNAGKWIDLLEELNKLKEEEKNGYFEKNKEISELNAKCKRLQEKIENKDNIIKEKERMIAILEKAIDMLSSKKEYHSKK